MTVLWYTFLVVVVLASTYLIIGIIKFLYFYFILLYFSWKKNGKKPIKKYVITFEDDSMDSEVIIFKKLKDCFASRYKLKEKYETPYECLVGWGRDLLSEKLYDKFRKNFSDTIAHSLIYSPRLNSIYIFTAILDHVLSWPDINWQGGYEE